MEHYYTIIRYVILVFQKGLILTGSNAKPFPYTARAFSAMPITLLSLQLTE